MAGLIYVDLEPRNRAVEVWGGEQGRFTLRLQVINMSPFEVELDRAVVTLNIAGNRFESQYIHRTKFAAGTIDSLRIEGKVSAEEQEIVRRLMKDGRDHYIRFEGYFNSILHPFAKAPHELSGVFAHFVNWPKEGQGDA